MKIMSTLLFLACQAHAMESTLYPENPSSLHQSKLSERRSLKLENIPQSVQEEINRLRKENEVYKYKVSTLETSGQRLIDFVKKVTATNQSLMDQNKELVERIITLETKNVDPILSSDKKTGFLLRKNSCEQINSF